MTTQATNVHCKLHEEHGLSVCHLCLSDFINVGFSEATFGADLHDPLQSLLTARAVLTDHRLHNDNITHPQQ